MPRRAVSRISRVRWCADDRGAVCKSPTLKCETAPRQTGRQFAEQPFHQEILQKQPLSFKSDVLPGYFS